MNSGNASGENNFCSNCGKLLNLESKFCGNCGKAIFSQKEKTKYKEDVVSERVEKPVFVSPEELSEEEIKKNEKKVSRAGNFAVWLGWLRIGLPLPLYIFLRFLEATDESYIEGIFFDLPNVVWTIAEGILLVILGERIKNQTINTKKYIKVLLYFLVPWSVFGLILGGGGGDIINMFLVIALFTALSAVNKLLNNEKYKASLKKVDYKFKGFHWVLFGIATFILFGVASFLNELNPNF